MPRRVELASRSHAHRRRLEVNIGEELLGTLWYFMYMQNTADNIRIHEPTPENISQILTFGGATVRRNTNCTSTFRKFVNSAASAKEHSPLQADNIGRLRLSAMLHREP